MKIQFEKMKLTKFLTVTFCLFNNLVFCLKSCLTEKDQQRVCFNGTSYNNPFPVVLETTLYLQEIVKIDEEENSICIQVDLFTTWTDPDLDSSNGTAV